MSAPLLLNSSYRASRRVGPLRVHRGPPGEFGGDGLRAARTCRWLPSIAYQTPAAAHIGQHTHRRFDRLTQTVHFLCTRWSDFMKYVGIRQARQELPDLIDRAEA